ncbi:MAG: hypothetical protein ACREMC_08700, partial [Gemmatimonadales bacterium]
VHDAEHPLLRHHAISLSPRGLRGYRKVPHGAVRWVTSLAPSAVASAPCGVPERDGVEPFSPAESAQIRAMFTAATATVVCPRCRGALKFTSVPGPNAATTVWELECGACQRRLVVGERPA